MKTSIKEHTATIAAAMVSFSISVMAQAGMVDSDTLLYFSGAKGQPNVVNEATSPSSFRLTAIGSNGNITPLDETSSSLLYSGVQGGALPNTEAFMVGDWRWAAGFAEQDDVSYCNGDFTFECIFKTESVADNNYLFYHPGGWMLRFGSGCSTLLLRDSKWGLLGTAENVNDGKWHHVAVVQDVAEGSISFYFDYRCVSVSPVEKREENPSTENIMLGAYEPTNYSFGQTNIAYDEVRIEKRALSSAEFISSEMRVVRERRLNALMGADTLVYVPFDEQRFVTDENVARERNAQLPSVTISAAVNPTREAQKVQMYSSACDGGTPYSNETALHVVKDDGEASARLIMSDAGSYLKDDFTLEIMVKADDLSKLVSVGNYKLIYVFDQEAFYLQWNDAGCVRLVNSEWTPTKFSPCIVDGKWHHLAVVWRQDEKLLSLYVDHRLLESIVCESDLSDYADRTLYVGCGHWAVRQYNAGDACYDELRLTQKALSPAEFLSPRTMPIALQTVYYNSFNADDERGDISLKLTSLRRSNYAQQEGGRLDFSEAGVSSLIYGCAIASNSYPNAAAFFADKVACDQAGVGGGYIIADTLPSVVKDSFTFETFFRLDRAPTEQAYILSHHGAWHAYVTAQGFLRVCVNDFDVQVVTRSIDVTDNTWHHLAVVYDKGEKSFCVYLDYRLIGCVGNCEDVVKTGAEAAEEMYVNGYQRVMTEAGATYALRLSFTKIWLDELRISSKALRVTEFLTSELLDDGHVRLRGRFENGVLKSLSPDSQYAPVAITEGGTHAAKGSSVRPAKTVSECKGGVFAENAFGVALENGRLIYPGTGVLDLPVGTTEFFVKGASVGVEANNVVAWASGVNAGTAIWELTTDSRMRLSVGGKVEEKSVNAPLFDGKWHHVAISHEAANGIVVVTLYVDYAKDCELSVLGMVSFERPTSLVFGSDGFKGALDEVRVNDKIIGSEDFMRCGPKSGCILLFR